MLLCGAAHADVYGFNFFNDGALMPWRVHAVLASGLHTRLLLAMPALPCRLPTPGSPMHHPLHPHSSHPGPCKRRPGHKMSVEQKLVTELERRMEGRLTLHPTPCTNMRHCGPRPKGGVGLCDAATLPRQPAPVPG